MRACALGQALRRFAPARRCVGRYGTSRFALLAAFALLASVRPAHADCESGVAALTAMVARLSDARLRTQLQTDLQRAQTDLWEFDEVECATVLGHAARIIKLAPGAVETSATANMGTN